MITLYFFSPLPIWHGHTKLSIVEVALNLWWMNEATDTWNGPSGWRANTLNLWQCNVTKWHSGARWNYYIFYKMKILKVIYHIGRLRRQCLLKSNKQGCAVSRYSLSRAWIKTVFRLGIGLERHIYGCRLVSRVEKIHFAYNNDTFCVSRGLETVSESVSRDTLMCVEHNLGF